MDKINNKKQLYVGIIIPSKRRFNDWVSLFGLIGERYIHLDREEKCRGHVFSKILKSDDWYTMENAEDILTSAESRIRKRGDE